MWKIRSTSLAYNIEVIVLYYSVCPKAGIYIKSGSVNRKKIAVNEELYSHCYKLNIQKLVYYTIGV